ncbi:hypothetical protein Tco_0827744 [Tanacetum coccineum]
MDNPNITMEEYIRLEEEKARRRGKVYNWETATYATVSSINDNEIDFRISFDESDDEDYTLNELAELRDGAYENTRIYKERTKKWHDSRLCGDKDFKVGDKVLLYNSCLKMYPGKLISKWSDPNIVKTVYPHRAIEITNRDGFSFKVNGQRLKKYYRRNIDKEDDEVIDLENDSAQLKGV